MRSLLLVFMLLGACHGVGETGPRGIKGVLLDSSGDPIRAQRVVSEDHGTTTDSEGRFEVRWKDPTTFIDFQRGGLTWRRVWLREKDAGEVTVQLPSLQQGELICRAKRKCVADVTWDVGGGLLARTRVRCGESVPASLIPEIPESLPTARCGDDRLSVTDEGGRFVVGELVDRE